MSVRIDCYLYNTVTAAFKQTVCLLNAAQRKAVGYERRCVDFTIYDKPQYFITITTVNASGLEREVFAVHIRQRQYLGMLIKSHHSDNGIRTRRLPRHSESIVRTGHFNNTVGTTMLTDSHHHLEAVFRAYNTYLGIKAANKVTPRSPLFTNYDILRLFKPQALKSAQTSRTSSDNQHSVIFRPQ